MSGEKECPACAMAPRRALHILEPSCTGRAGCVRAAGTEGGATDGMGTRAVDWPGESELNRLRAEVERLTAERDDAATDAVRRVRSGEIVVFMGPDVVLMPRAQSDSDHELVIRLRAENERLRGDAALLGEILAVMHRDGGHAQAEWGSHDATERAIASWFAMLTRVEDRAGRDIAVVKAALEVAAERAGEEPLMPGDPTPEHMTLMQKAGPVLTARSAALTMRDAIEQGTRAIDPEAVLKMMEDGR